MDVVVHGGDDVLGGRAVHVGGGEEELGQDDAVCGASDGLKSCDRLDDGFEELGADGAGEDAGDLVGDLAVSDGLLEDDGALGRGVGEGLAGHEEADVDGVGVVEVDLEHGDERLLEERVGVAQINKGLDGLIYNRARQHICP